MCDSIIIVDMIISKLVEYGGAQSTKVFYKYAGKSAGAVQITRQTGLNWVIKNNEVKIAVEAVREDFSIYNGGPTTLRPYLGRPIHSPLWAMLRLIPLDQILD
jgi:hypothetical protein